MIFHLVVKLRLILTTEPDHYLQFLDLPSPSLHKLRKMLYLLQFLELLSQNLNPSIHIPESVVYTSVVLHLRDLKQIIHILELVQLRYLDKLFTQIFSLFQHTKHLDSSHSLAYPLIVLLVLEYYLEIKLYSHSQVDLNRSLE
jgi:hypothetical protein